MAEDPGYIKGYVPGVRENGGQYTHAALWVVLAHLLRGDGDEASALLDLINPINHSLTREAAEHYVVEPYVVAADVYAASPAHRPRRLDLVHRLGVVVLPRGAAVHARPAHRR